MCDFLTKKLLKMLVHLNVIVTTLGLFLLCSCSAFTGPRDGLVRSSSCTKALEELFSKTYHPFLVENCASCHQSGGVGKGSFADDSLDVAYSDFNLRGAKLIMDRAVDPNHNSPYTGPQHTDTANDLETLWITEESKMGSCNPLSADDVLPDDEPLPSSANFITVEKSLGSLENTATLSWDLTTELSFPANAAFSGVVFEIDVQKITSVTGSTSYQFANPILRTSSSAIRVTLIEVSVNQEFQSTATTYRGIDRWVPANDQRTLAVSSMVLPFEAQDSDTLSINFGIIEEVTFNPSTFAALSNEIFQGNCVSCHNANNQNGGLDLTNYDNLISQFLVSPYSPKVSEIYKKMSDPNNPMPPTGPLSEEDQQKVYDWILDGAPQN